MGEAVSSVLTYAVGVAISPVPIIAVILMLFSPRARVNGSVFLAGWVGTLSVLSAVVYLLANTSNPTTGGAASDAISWGKIALGAALLLLSLRTWRSRPEPGTDPPLPKWMAGIDTLTPAKVLGLSILLAGVNPKNLVLTIGTATKLAQLDSSTTDVVVALAVFVVIASLTIAIPVVYYLLGGERAKTQLDSLKDWLRVNNATVMTVLFLIFGVDLIATGIPSLT